MKLNARLAVLTLIAGFVGFTNVDFDQIGTSAFLVIGAKAQAAGTDAIGQVDELYGSATVSRSGSGDAALSVGADIYQEDVIRTGQNGSVGIIFVDETNFALGPNGEMTLDEFAYNPSSKSNALLNVAHGTFAFVSGNLAHSGEDAMLVTTPTLTIGVRGTKVAGDENTAILLPNEDESVGKIMTSTDVDKKLLTQKYQAATAKDRKSKITTAILTRYEVETNFLKALKALRDKSRIETQQKGQTGNSRDSHDATANEGHGTDTTDIINHIADEFLSFPSGTP